MNFAEMNANLIVIRVTFAKSGSTMTATNCPKKGCSAKFRQVFFWKCEECLDLKIKHDKLKQSFEKITNEIQNASLAIQNNLDGVSFSLLQNNDQILTIQKETAEIKIRASWKQFSQTSDNFLSIERDAIVLRKNISKQSS